jgi:hypothetical protein
MAQFLILNICKQILADVSINFVTLITPIRDRRILCNRCLFGNKKILHVHVSSSQNTWQRIVVPDSYLLASLLDERAAHLSDMSPPAYFPRLQSDFNAR